MQALRNLQKLPKIQLKTNPYLQLRQSTLVPHNFQSPVSPLLFNNTPRYNFSIFSPKSTLTEVPENLKELKEFKPEPEEFPNPVHELVEPGKEKIVGSWLLLTAGAVFFMIVLGGYTRLTNSGLSMTKWKPIDPKLPSSNEQWEKEFEHYKQFPEYQLFNKNMDVEGFKKIFFVEWFHRFVGSSIGVIFTVPFLYFLQRGHIKAPMRNRLLGMLALGGTQGLIGWWMVKSGMQQKPDYQDKPRVSPYRLLVHLNAALVIYSFLLWNGLTLLRAPQEKLIRPEHLKGNKILRFWGIMLLHCVALNTLSGATAAGIDAMKVFNDWPLYHGKLTPPKMWDIEPFYKNFFENKGTTQFNHRNFGYLTFAMACLTFAKCRNIGLAKHQKKYLNLMLFLVCLQVLNGIATLKHGVLPKEANVHQGNAVLVLSSVILITHAARRPNKAYTKYLQQFISQQTKK